MIRGASDQQILNCYLHCPKCNQPLIDWPQRFLSTDAFITTVTAALMAHSCAVPVDALGRRVKECVGIVDLRTIPEGSAVCFLIGRVEVESGLFQRAESMFALDHLPTGTHLLHLRGRVVVATSGYDDDPREVQEIPEMRRYYSGLMDRLPWLLFFTPQSFSLPILFCLIGSVSTERRDARGTARVYIKRDEFDAWVTRLVKGTAPVLARAGLSDEDATALMTKMTDELLAAMDGRERAA